jgi:cytoskeletal protein CcmA (bactofilin family)
MMNEDNKAGFLEIGEGVLIEGNISLPETVYVNGNVNGDLRASNVMVGPNGVINGNVFATTADIRGSINHTINITGLLILRSTAKVIGDIEYQMIEIEEGANVNAALKHIGSVAPSVADVQPELTSQLIA